MTAGLAEGRTIRRAHRASTNGAREREREIRTSSGVVRNMDALGETSDEANVVESVAVDHPAAIPDEVAREQHREGEYLNSIKHSLNNYKR